MINSVDLSEFHLLIVACLDFISFVHEPTKNMIPVFQYLIFFLYPQMFLRCGPNGLHA